MSVTSSVDDVDEVPEDFVEGAEVDDAFGGAPEGCATPPVEMEDAFDPREIEDDEMIETVNIWDMPIFDVAEKSGNCILSKVLKRLGWFGGP